MSFCTSDVLLLAGSIYTGIGAPSAQSVGYVSGWITQPSTIGDLNNRLTAGFYLSGDSPCIAGCFGNPEASILSQMYITDYYRQRANTVLAGADVSAWTSMAEGDTKVARETRVGLAKAYLELSKDAQQALYVAVANWKLAHSIPLSIDGSSLYSYPSP